MNEADVLIEELLLYQRWVGSRDSHGCMGLRRNFWGPHQSCGTQRPIVMALNLSDLSTQQVTLALAVFRGFPWKKVPVRHYL